MSIDPDHPVASGKVGPGALLIKAREAKGLHISVLATSLRMPVIYLQALEAEQWSQLPDIGFARSLAMSVCRQLGIDSQPVLAGMPSLHALQFARVALITDAPLGEMPRAVRIKHRLGWGIGLLLTALSAWVAWGIHGDAAERPSASVVVPNIEEATAAHAPLAVKPDQIGPNQTGTVPTSQLTQTVEIGSSPSQAASSSHYTASPAASLESAVPAVNSSPTAAKP